MWNKNLGAALPIPLYLRYSAKPIPLYLQYSGNIVSCPPTDDRSAVTHRSTAIWVDMRTSCALKSRSLPHGHLHKYVFLFHSINVLPTSKGKGNGNR